MKSNKERSRERREYIKKRIEENLKLLQDDPDSLFAPEETK